MTPRIKVTLIALAILIGVVTLIFYFSTHQKEKHFQLIDHVSESDIAFHTDFVKLLDEAIKYNTKIGKSISNNIALNEAKSMFLKSGLKLDNTYLTYSFSEEKYASFYAEIIDTALFETAFKKLSKHFNIKLFKENSNLYISGNTLISAEIHPHYVRLNFGNGALNALSEQKEKSGKLFKKLLEKSDFGVLNTAGTTRLDSTDYATFSYAYGEELSFILDWRVAENHPLRSNKNKSIPVYPSHKNKVRAIANIDIEHLISTLNPFLKEKGAEVLDKLPPSVIPFLELWNGRFSLKMGGKSTKETLQFVTEFDDDFNQIVTETVKIDSVPDIGMYWGSIKPSESLTLAYKLPNVRSVSNKLQIALLPSLNIKTESKSIKASTQQIKYKEQSLNKLLFINVASTGMNGKISIEKTSDQNVRFNLVLKEWSALKSPKKLAISSFW